MKFHQLNHAAIAVLTFALGGACLATAQENNGSSWTMFGQNPSNTASAGAGSGISVGNAARLTKKWVATTGGDVSARAAVAGGAVFFPDWGGNLWALKTSDGSKIWSHQFSDYVTGAAAGSIHSRSTPAVVDGVLYIGTQEGGWLMAIRAANGALLWKTQVEPSDPLAVLTASPVVVDGIIYGGVASLQEGAAANPAFPCCTARGSVYAVLASTGDIVWKTYTVPTGYSGGGVWGSNAVVDEDSNTLFVGTGNNYTRPASVRACISAGSPESACLSPDDHVDSILALDLRHGNIKWSKRLTGGDDWNVGCIVAVQTNCPSTPNPAGPDYDFSSAPNLFTVAGPHGPRKILGAGQKSGLYSAFDPATGAILWQTQVGPGSSLGGIEWGSATDGKRIYVNITNLYGIPYAAGNAGSVAALDAATGAILWQKADPNGAIDLGPVAVANGVVFTPSMAGGATTPNMFALDAATGKQLWSFASGGSVIAGASIAGGTVYWGSGYAHIAVPGFVGNNQFYAFAAPGGDNSGNDQ